MKRKIVLATFAALLLAACGGGGSGSGGSGGGGGGGGDACTLGGTIDREVTLSPTQCSPYRVTSDVTVGDTGKLVISPGTVIQFAQDTGISVSGHGALVAVGTASDKILFTGASKTRGYWKGITFDAANSFDNELKYVEIEYAGADERWDSGAYGKYRAALDIQERSRLKITYTLIRESGGSGIFLDMRTYIGTDNTPNGDFAHNIITKNASYPIIMYADQVGFLDRGNDLSGNDAGYDYVRVAGGYSDAAIHTQTWQQLVVPYLIESLTYVADKETLTIAPGTTLVFEQDAGLEANGKAAAIRAEGTATEPITFTGLQHHKGYWAGLHFNDSDSHDNVLRHVIVEYGGSENGEGDDYGNVVVSSGGNASHQRIVVENSTIRHSAHWGISVAKETVFTVNGITYADNTDGNFRQRP